MTPRTTKSQPANTLIQRLKARFRRTVLPIVVKPAGARIIITSVPKAGTHLLEKTVAMLPGYYTANMYIEQFEMPAQTFTGDTNGQGEVKQARARQLSIDELQAITDTIKPGHYAVGHLVFSKPLAEMLDRTGVKVHFARPTRYCGLIFKIRRTHRNALPLQLLPEPFRSRSAYDHN